MAEAPELRTHYLNCNKPPSAEHIALAGNAATYDPMLDNHMLPPLPVRPLAPHQPLP